MLLHFCSIFTSCSAIMGWIMRIVLEFSRTSWIFPGRPDNPGRPGFFLDVLMVPLNLAWLHHNRAGRPDRPGRWINLSCMVPSLLPVVQDPKS